MTKENKVNGEYIRDITESEKNSRSYGDVQVLVASDTEKPKTFEVTGNQSSEYYKK